jgi:hypothetical protein
MDPLAGTNTPRREAHLHTPVKITLGMEMWEPSMMEGGRHRNGDCSKTTKPFGSIDDSKGFSCRSRNGQS